MFDSQEYEKHRNATKHDQIISKSKIRMSLCYLRRLIRSSCVRIIKRGPSGLKNFCVFLSKLRSNEKNCVFFATFLQIKRINCATKRKFSILISSSTFTMNQRPFLSSMHRLVGLVPDLLLRLNS